MYRASIKALSVLLLIAAPLEYSNSCGIILAEPKSYFDAVDFQGHAHHVEKLGSVNIEEIALPVYFIFNSSYATSPYAGAFEIPLLQSRMEQVDENIFLLRGPTGWQIPFVRRSKNGNILDGGGGFKAEIDESQHKISAWAECGSKLTFIKGKIVEFEIEGKKLSYIYYGEKVSEIRHRGTTVLKVFYSSDGEMVQGLALGTQGFVGFEWGKKPILQSIINNVVVGGVTDTVTRLSYPDGKQRRFEFLVNSEMLPVLKIDENALISWNHKTNLVDQVEGWKYSVAPGVGIFDYASITRKNEKGQSESWKFDGEHGTEYFKEVDGTEARREWFVSGPLAGKTRRVVQSKDGKTFAEQKMNYDESGNLLREIAYNGNSRYEWRANEAVLERAERAISVQSKKVNYRLVFDGSHWKYKVN